MTQPTVAIVRNSNVDPSILLEEAVRLVALRERIKARIDASQHSGFSVVIVPAIESFSANSPAATDPLLVEQIIDVLFDLGVTRVVVGSTKDTASLWLENRDVVVVADLLGYRFETAKDRPYEVVDLAEDLVHDAFPETSPLAGAGLSREWLEADLRIVFAANRTDDGDGYALCLSTLLTVLPHTDKDYHYRYRRNIGAVVAALAAIRPVDFSFIDAIVSAHGNCGGGSLAPLRTDTIIAATAPALADHYGAILMGLDPFISSVAAQAMRQPGLLDEVVVLGSLDPYPGWRNADPVLRKSVAFRRQSVWIDRNVRPLLQQADQNLFPFRNVLHDQLNAALAPVFAMGEDGQNHFLSVAMLNFWLGAIGCAATAWSTLFSKDALRRREVPLNIDPLEIPESAFDAIASELIPLTELLRGVPADETGLRWRTYDSAILFDGVRRFPIPFEEFVRAVEIRRSIEFMNDFIGGHALPVGRDPSGRVTKQIERNLYLPQPNYAAFLGGRVIDVTKIERIDYGLDRQCMVWKTIKSENDSAVWDDGIVTFEALGEDTCVTVFGRQQFRLPPLLAEVDLDLSPTTKQLLVTEAYRTYFRGTFANLEAVAEGRDVRIGKAWTESGDGEPFATASLARLIAKLQEDEDLDVVGWLRSKFTASAYAALTPIRIDSDGFHHFVAPAQEARNTKTGVQGVIFDELLRSALVDMGVSR